MLYLYRQPHISYICKCLSLFLCFLWLGCHKGHLLTTVHSRISYISVPYIWRLLYHTQGGKWWHDIVVLAFFPVACNHAWKLRGSCSKKKWWWGDGCKNSISRGGRNKSFMSLIAPASLSLSLHPNPSSQLHSTLHTIDLIWAFQQRWPKHFLVKITQTVKGFLIDEAYALAIASTVAFLWRENDTIHLHLSLFHSHVLPYCAVVFNIAVYDRRDLYDVKRYCVCTVQYLLMYGTSTWCDVWYSCCIFLSRKKNHVPR